MLSLGLVDAIAPSGTSSSSSSHFVIKIIQRKMNQLILFMILIIKKS